MGIVPRERTDSCARQWWLGWREASSRENPEVKISKASDSINVKSVGGNSHPASGLLGEEELID